jgi:hypothetical protein
MVELEEHNRSYLLETDVIDVRDRLAEWVKEG